MMQQPGGMVPSPMAMDQQHPPPQQQQQYSQQQQWMMQQQPPQLWQQQQQPPQYGGAPTATAASGGADEIRSLWIGDLQFWMDESYLTSCFAHTGELISAKVIRNKQTGQSEGYGFLEFRARAAADNILQSYNGTMMPNSEQTYRLNWASLGSGDKRTDDGPEHTVFVGDLAADVTDYILQETFKAVYSSVKGAKVVTDRTTGRSKGYGFVKFGDEIEQQRAMTEMNGVLCSTRPMRIGPAANKKPVTAPTQRASYQNPQGNQGESDPNNTTIFVGGLDPNVMDEHLKQVFSQYGELIHVKIPLGKRCGFVQFADRSCAEQALSNLNGTMIGGQTVRLSWGRSPSNKQSDQNQWSGAGGASGPYYGYTQGYEAYGGYAPPQDPSMYYGGYPGYGNYQQQSQQHRLDPPPVFPNPIEVGVRFSSPLSKMQQPGGMVPPPMAMDQQHPPQQQQQYSQQQWMMQQQPPQLWQQQQQQYGGTPTAVSGGADEIRTLWIGDLQYWMDEIYLTSSLVHTGELLSAKVIRNKQTGQPEGYGFLEFRTRTAADNILQTYNGTMMPNSEQTYRLNWASLGSGDKRTDDGPEHTVFVGDLAADVTDYILQETFKAVYSSVKGAKVVTDRTTGRSKGYGFVKFGDEREQQRAMTEMNGVLCSTRPMRIGPAANKKPVTAPTQRVFGTDSTLQVQIFVGGLDPNVTDEHLKQVFSQYGELIHVKIPLGKRCGFVQFSDRSCAEQALSNLNGTMIGGQTVRLSWGRSPSNKQVFLEFNFIWSQSDQNQWGGAGAGGGSGGPYYGYTQGYEAYGGGYAPPQDPSMYYGGYPGYGNYQQQPQQ
ncbi:hypothetical protein RD792_002490, partial [Penstemon davidsonii]